jgi:hypothetical protein
MMTYYAGSPEGPWHAAKKNFLFLPSVESAYFARFFRGKSNELLVTHQSYSHANTSYDTCTHPGFGICTYIAPYKKAVADAEGTLRLAWWPANDRFKGAVQAVEVNATSGFLTPPIDLKAGVIVEVRVILPATGAPPAGQPGFAFETEGGGLLVLATDSAGRGTLTNGTSSVYIWDRELGLVPGAKVALRLLYRRDMVELYLEDILLVLYLLPRCTGNLKLVHMSHTGDSTRRWAFNGSQSSGGKGPLGLGLGQGPPAAIDTTNLTRGPLGPS